MSKKLSREEVLNRINIPFDATINECWEWNGFMNPNGYGMVKGDFAHRYIYKLFKGFIPSSLCILHKCDNKKCVNPNHLSIGSRRANQVDMTIKNRQGTKRRLTDFQYVELIRLRNGGATYRELSEKFKISLETCCKILTEPTVYNNYAKLV
jgi:hypothetical protein